MKFVDANIYILQIPNNTHSMLYIIGFIKHYLKQVLFLLVTDAHNNIAITTISQ